MNPVTAETSPVDEGRALWRWLFGLAIAVPAWFLAYGQLEALADVLVGLLGLSHDTRLGEAVRFFLYDAPKVLMLLGGVVFLMGIVQTFFTPERTRALLAGRRLGAGNTLAALLGTVTPFCSCSAVPLFIGFLSAGVPLGVTFSYLIAAPMVNEIAVILLFGLFGWKVAALYVGMGLLIAILAGLVIGRLKMERQLEDWVREIQAGNTPRALAQHGGWVSRFRAGWKHVTEIMARVWLYVVAGIAVGALIHGFVPADFMASIMGRDAWWSVPAAVALGIPMYSNAAGVVPVVQALIGKGAALGTALAFMMSVIALSAPELLILRKVLKPRLIATFVGVVACGILSVGYLFNILL